jgi:rod shape-determining protein MreC
MRNLAKLIARYHFFLLFLLIQTITLGMVFSGNDFQQAFFMNFTRKFSGNLYLSMSGWNEYFSLKKTNEELVQENTRLKSALLMQSIAAEESHLPVDSLLGDKYFIVSARVINQTVNRQRNFLTLDVGRKDGVEPEMAVISGEGVIGIVAGVSDHFSTVLSILNVDARFSARLKNSGYFGSLFWDGRNYREVSLTEIPHHAEIQPGDTVLTSGYSAIFPEGIAFGKVADFNIVGANFYQINVVLFPDFKKLSNVYVLGNKLKEEWSELEKQSSDD